MKASIKKSPTGKPRTIKGSALTLGWLPIDWTAEQLTQHISAGYPFAVAHFAQGHRRGDNFQVSNVFATDHDKGSHDAGLTDVELSELINHDFVQRYAFAVIQTASSQPGARKCRILYHCPTDITDAETYSSIAAYLAKQVPFADQAPKDAARVFFGSRPGTIPDFTAFENVLDLESIQQALEQEKHPRPARQIQRHTEYTGQLDNGLPENFIRDIEQGLGFTGDLTRGGAMAGWSSPLACPIKHHEHDHESPAAYWHPEIHALKCFKCGDTYNAKTIGAALGLELKAYLPTHHPPSNDPITQQGSIRHITIHEPFITDAELPPLGDTIAIKGGVGSGKTEFIKRETAQDASLLSIGHLRRLIRNISARLGIEYYENIDSQTLSLISRLGISVNSLYKLVGKDGSLPTYHSLTIDEIEQVRAYLLNSHTLKGSEGKNAYLLICTLIQTAQRVFVADADLSQETLDWLVSLRGSVDVIENTYIRKRGQMTILNSQDELNRRLVETLKHSEKPVAIASDSKAVVKAYDKMLSEKGYLGLCIHADNADDPATEQILTHLSDNLHLYDYLVYSPSMATGVDIQAEVEGVFGVFLNRSITAEDQLQMLGRCRKAQQFYVYTREVEGHRETDTKKLRQDVLDNVEHHARSHGLTYEITPEGKYQPTKTDMDFLTLWAVITARRNALLNNARTAFILRAKREFEVSFEVAEDDEKFIDYRIAARQVKAETRERLLTSPPLSDEAYSIAIQEVAAGTREYSEDLKAGNERYHMEDFLGQTLTDPLLEFMEEGGASRLETFIDFYRTPKDLLNKDITEITTGIALQNRLTRSTRTKLMHLLLMTIFGDDLHFDAIPEDEFMLRLAAFNRLYDLHSVEKRFRRQTRTEKPIARLRWLLGRLGLRLQRKRGGHNMDIISYQLSEDHYFKMVELAQARLEHIREPVVIQIPEPRPDSERNTFVHKKDIPPDDESVAPPKKPPEDPPDCDPLPAG